jgi:hypothetical protein
MAKTLKDFLNERQLGPMVVKNPDEQKFIDKHVVAKTDDRNGNDDELFKGSKVKMADRKKDRKGYNPGEDEEVYEEAELAESKYEFDVSGEHGNAAVDKLIKHANSNGIKAKVHTYNGPGGGNPVIHLSHKDPKVVHAYAKKHIDPNVNLSNHKINEALKGDQHKIDANKNGKVDAHDFHLLRKKKKVAEEAEQIDELDHKLGGTLSRYINKTKDNPKREEGRNLALKKRWGDAKYGTPEPKVKAAVREEAEQVDEKLDMKKASMGTVVKDFQKSDAPQFQGKSQKKRQVMAIAAKLSAERGGKPLNKEERLLTKLADISETHQRTMVSVFEKLNEDNQREFMLACDTAEGIEQMLDFSIQHRGE